ncbi:MAG: mannosyltransferase MptB, partial [Pseudonocardia sp.]|nr:mannosyltransferase MptB [Pseudonocardia sp.]
MAAPRVGRISRSVEPPLGPSTIPLDFSKAVRRFGTTGALLMAIGALGAGALPVPNPLFGLRVLSLPPRTVTLSIAVTYAGMAMLVLAWLWLGRLLRRGPEGPGLPVSELTRTITLWALPLALAPPMFSRDVYSYIAQSAIAARGLDPYSVGPGPALGLDDPLTLSIPTIWRDTPAPYGPLFLMLGRA